MQLGAFSMSLSVKDLGKSVAFYQSLGFTQIAGALDENWAMMRNGETAIGLFHGMFEGNMLTFNPGWSAEEEEIESFTDIREIQAKLEASGFELKQRTDTQGTGPAFVSILDPDGNEVFIDQHVSKPKSD